MHNARFAAIGTPKELCALVGPQATLDDVFVALTGHEVKKGDEHDAGRPSLNR